MTNFLNRLFKNKRNSHNKENNELPNEFDRENSIRISSRYNNGSITLKDNQSYLNPTAPYHTNNSNNKWKPGPRSCPGEQMSFKSNKNKKDLDRSFATEFQPPNDHKSSRRKQHYTFKNSHDTSEYGSVEPPVENENHRRSFHEEFEESEGEALTLAEARIHNLEDALSRYKLRLKDALEDRRYYRSQYVALQHSKHRTERNLLQQIEDLNTERKHMQHKISVLERQVEQYRNFNCHNNSLINMDNSKFHNQMNLFGTPSTSAVDSITGAGEALSNMSENPFIGHRNEQLSSNVFVDDNLDEVKNFRNIKLDLLDMNRSVSEE